MTYTTDGSTIRGMAADEKRIDEAIDRAVEPVADDTERQKIADWLREFITRNDARWEARRQQTAA